MSEKIFLDHLNREKRAGNDNSDKAQEEGGVLLPFDPGERAQSMQQEFYRLHREIKNEITSRMEDIQNRLDDLEPNPLDSDDPHDNEPTDWILNRFGEQATDLREARAHIATITTYWEQKELEISRDIQLLQEAQVNQILMPNGYTTYLFRLQQELSTMSERIQNTLPGHLATIDLMLPTVYERAESLLNTRLDRLDQTYLSVRGEIETPLNTLHSVITSATADGIIGSPQHTQHGTTAEKIHELMNQLNGSSYVGYEREIEELRNIIDRFDGEQISSSIHQRMSEHNAHVAELRGISHAITLTEEVLSHIALQNQVMEDRDALAQLMRVDDNPVESLHHIISSSEKVNAVIRQYRESLVELDEVIDSLGILQNPSQSVQNSLAILKQIHTLMEVRSSFISELENSSSKEPEVEVSLEETPSVEPPLFQEEGAVGGVIYPTGAHDRAEDAIGAVAVGTTFGAIVGSIAGPLGALGGAAVGAGIGRLANESGIMEEVDPPEGRTSPESHIYYDSFHYYTDL